MLTTEPGPDVAPYHGRQVALLAPSAWAAWLDHEAAAGDLLGPAPAGSVVVRADRVGVSALENCHRNAYLSQYSLNRHEI